MWKRSRRPARRAGEVEPHLALVLGPDAVEGRVTADGRQGPHRVERGVGGEQPAEALAPRPALEPGLDAPRRAPQAPGLEPAAALREAGLDQALRVALVPAEPPPEEEAR